MNHTIANRWISVEISSCGAEVQSVKGAATGREYWWNGDAAYWHRRSPLLFPVVGRLSGNKALFGGRAYPMAKHGLMQDADFRLVSLQPRTAVFRAVSTARTHKHFPFAFQLDVTYTVRANRLEVTWNVQNTGARPMPMHIGGHPALLFPDFDAAAEVKAYVETDARLPLQSATVAPSGCLAQRRYVLEADKDGRVPLTQRLFDTDAVIFDGNQVKRVTLCDRNRVPYVTVTSKAPCFLLWSPEGKNAPFVCMEPWYGLCDADGFEGEFASRPYTTVVAPGRRAVMGYNIHFEAEVAGRLTRKKFEL